MQEELQNLTKILLENLILKIKKIRVKIGDIHRIEKKIILPLVFLIYISKKYCEEKNVDLSLTGEESKRHTMSLSKIIIHLCMILHYIVEQNIFAVMI